MTWWDPPARSHAITRLIICRIAVRLAVSFHRRQHGTVAWYESSMLTNRGVAHGFYTRHGGVSGPPFESLNCGYAVSDVRPDGDLIEQIESNIERVIAGRSRPLIMVQQVHGNEVLGAGAGGQCGDAIALQSGEGTAGILTADCCPVLLAHVGDAGAVAVAAVHAGWRGLVAGVIEAATARVCELAKADVADVVAAVGPCIGPVAFEVGEEVAAAFQRRFPNKPDLVRRRADWPRPHVDLPAAAAAALEGAGVATGSVDMAGLCTVERADEFFSHRRDGGRTGRMLNVISAWLFRRD